MVIIRPGLVLWTRRGDVYAWHPHRYSYLAVFAAQRPPPPQHRPEALLMPADRLIVAYAAPLSCDIAQPRPQIWISGIKVKNLPG